MTTTTRTARIGNRFSRFNRPVACRGCGRITHSDLDGNVGLALCRECREAAEMENEHSDGHHEGRVVAGCADCARRAEVVVEQADAARVEAFNALPRAEREAAVRDIPVVSAPDAAAALDALMSGLCALHGHDADLPRLGTIEAVHESTLSVRWENGDAEVVARSGAVVARSQYGLGEEWSVGDEVREAPTASLSR